MATSPKEGMESLYRNLESATGKSIDEWAAIGRQSGIGKHKPLVDHIKQVYGLTHGYANQIALRALARENGGENEGELDLIAGQYAGSRAALKPLYDAAVEAISAFGDDIEFSPKKAYVSLRRRKQFGILQPGSGRIDIGLVLKDAVPTERLEVAGSFNAMVTHRVRVTEVADLDPELLGWLRAAYDAA